MSMSSHLYPTKVSSPVGALAALLCFLHGTEAKNPKLAHRPRAMSSPRLRILNITHIPQHFLEKDCKFERTIEQISSSSPCLPPDRLGRTFLIDAGEIQSVKQHIRAQSQTAGEQPDTPPSTYLAVSSLVWTSVARAKSGDLAGGDAYFLVVVDFRRRLGPAIDERYFGDCVVPCVARTAVHDLLDGGGAGVACAAAAIRDAIRAQPECPVRAMEAWLESLRTLPMVRERFTFTGSSNRFMAYETDFGWGAPSRVELVSLYATEHVLLLGGAQDGGVQVTATLRPEHMEAFASNLGRFSAVGCGLDGQHLPRGWAVNEIPSTPDGK